MVEIHQILAMDVVDIGVLDHPAIGRVAAINDVAEFAVRNPVGIVVAARDFAARLRFRQIHFVLAELGRSEQIPKERQHLIGVFLQARERQRPIGLADLAFDGCRHIFQILIELIAGAWFSFRPNAAPRR